MKLWKIKADIRRIVIESLDLHGVGEAITLSNSIVNDITDKLYETIHQQVNEHMINFLKEITESLENEL